MECAENEQQNVTGNADNALVATEFIDDSKQIQSEENVIVSVKNEDSQHLNHSTLSMQTRDETHHEEVTDTIAPVLPAPLHRQNTRRHSPVNLASEIINMFNQDLQYGCTARVLADFSIHKPHKIAEAVELIDEDGVMQFETRFQLLGMVAQHMGLVFQNPSLVALLTTRSANCFNGTSGDRFSDARDFRYISSDHELTLLVKRWASPVAVKKRLHELLLRALSEIEQKMQSGNTLVLTECFHELWELALHRPNHMSISHAHVRHVVAAVSKGSLGSPESAKACGCLWALVADPRTRHLAIQEGAAEVLLSVLTEDSKTLQPDMPLAHRLALRAMRGVFASSHAQRRLLDPHEAHAPQDSVRFPKALVTLRSLVYLLKNTADAEARRHLAAAVSWCVVKGPFAVKLLDRVGGCINPQECHVPRHVPAGPESAELEMLAKTLPTASQIVRYLVESCRSGPSGIDLGVSLCMAESLSLLANHSPATRSLVLWGAKEAAPLVEVISRAVVSCVRYIGQVEEVQLPGVPAPHDGSTPALLGKVERGRRASMSLDDKVAAEQESFQEQIIRRPSVVSTDRRSSLSSISEEGGEGALGCPLDRDDEILEQIERELESSPVPTMFAQSFLSQMGVEARAPEVLGFACEEWQISKNRAAELLLLHSCGVLWGLSSAISRLSSAKEAVNQRESSRRGKELQSTLANLRLPQLVRTLLALAIAAQEDANCRPAVALVALAALDGLANAATDQVRQSLLQSALAGPFAPDALANAVCFDPEAARHGEALAGCVEAAQCRPGSFTAVCALSVLGGALRECVALELPAAVALPALSLQVLLKAAGAEDRRGMGSVFACASLMLHAYIPVCRPSPGVLMPGLYLLPEQAEEHLQREDGVSPEHTQERVLREDGASPEQSESWAEKDLQRESRITSEQSESWAEEHLQREARITSEQSESWAEEHVQRESRITSEQSESWAEEHLQREARGLPPLPRTAQTGWGLEELAVLGQLLRQVPPGRRLRYLCLTVWGLGRDQVLRGRMNALGFPQALREVVKESLAVIECFSTAAKEEHRNLRSQLQRARAMSQAGIDVTEAAAGPTSANRAKHLFELLDGALSALWLLAYDDNAEVRQRAGMPRAGQASMGHSMGLGTPEQANGPGGRPRSKTKADGRHGNTSKEDCVHSETSQVDDAYGNTSGTQDKTNSASSKHDRSRKPNSVHVKANGAHYRFCPTDHDKESLVKTMCQVLYGVNSFGPWSKSSGEKETAKLHATTQHKGKFVKSSTLWEVHRDLVHPVGEKCISTIWVLAWSRTADTQVIDKALLRILLTTVYNPKLPTTLRIKTAKLLLFLKRLPALSPGDPPPCDAMYDALGKTFLAEVILGFLGSSQESLRACGAAMVPKVQSAGIGQALIQHRGGARLLIDLAATGSKASVVRAALQALLFFSFQEASQRHLAKVGLNELLELSWKTRDPFLKGILSQILSNLSRNPENKTDFYKAELRARYIAGWAGNGSKPAGKSDRRASRVSSVSETKCKEATLSSGVKLKYLNWLQRTFGLENEQSGGTQRGSEFKNHPQPPAKPRSRSRANTPKIRQVSLRKGASLEEVFKDLDVSPDSQHNGEKQGAQTDSDEIEERMYRSLSGFLLANRELEMSRDEANELKPSSTTHNSASTFSARCTLKTMKLNKKNTIFAYKSDPHKKKTIRVASTTKESEKFIVHAPNESPWWEFKEEIASSKLRRPTEASEFPKDVRPTLQGVDPTIHPEPKVFAQSHGENGSFTEGEYRLANHQLHKRLKKPTRELWHATAAQGSSGAQRWCPHIRDISLSGRPNAENPGGSSEDVVVQVGRSDERPVEFTFFVEAQRKRVLTQQEEVARLRDPKLAKFRHVPGARVHCDLPEYLFPDGSSCYLYSANPAYCGPPSALDDPDLPPHPPLRLGDLALPGNRLPAPPRVVYGDQWLDHVLGARALPLCPTAPTAPEGYSLRDKGKQGRTGIRWSPLGVVQDENMPLRTAEMKDEAAEAWDTATVPEPPWSVQDSVFRPRQSLWRDETVVAAAFENDWMLCLQKRNFLKLISANESALQEVQQVLRVNYGKLCDIFRFYSAAADGTAAMFTMQLNEYSEFINTTGIRDDSPGSNMHEGYCDTLFVQVCFNTLDQLTEDQRRFDRECALMSLRKGHSMMRFQFMEVVVRLAKAKYLDSALAPDLPAALVMLMERNIDATLGAEYILNTDNFRRDRLYNQAVDDELRKNLAFLKKLFQEFAGCMMETDKFGGRKHKRLNVIEWHQLLESVPLYNNFFTYRESSVVFKSSIMDIADEIRQWRLTVSLTFISFLEAIARTADIMVIPTQAQLDDVGADDIVEFYRIMDSTGLWDTVLARDGPTALARRTMTELQARSAGHRNLRNGAKAVELDPRPLAEKLKALLSLMRHMKARQQRLDREAKLWLDTGRRTSATSVKSSSSVLGIEHDSGLYYVPLRERGMDRITKDKFEASVAATLHDVWRERRGRDASNAGLYVPRIKVIDGVEYDIANLHFSKLPGHFQMENLLAAHAACESIRREFQRFQDEGKGDEQFTSYIKSQGFLEVAGEFQHIQWLKRNGKKVWVEDHQRLPYGELSEEEKQKDRVIVETAVKVWLLNRTKLE